ncbi:phospholipase D family protein [Oceanobacillus damuensis]|uniref:phospholipase D family protein n=1 Tax=Oceanobacillus damuensis TaxID=937928 RepID=UPI00082F9939|nr:phospholipase D family protein [Oceanobacillus damuensis]
MLKPDKNRLNYSDMLKPPAGFEVDFAVGTTYSLDLEALIGVPLALGLSEEMDQTLREEPIYILEALRRTSDKYAIFCEAGQIKVPQSGNSIFALLEDSVFEVALKNERSFHPKIWLVKYQNEDGNKLYRLLVLTRNLTFDRSWDIALALEGEKREELSDKSKPLADFLNYLTQYATNQNRTEKIRDLISEIEYIHFEPGKNFPDFDFLPIGIDGYGKENTGIFDFSYHQLIVMSPFISESTLKELQIHRLSDEKGVLLTRRTELHKLSESILDNFKIYVLKEMIVEGEETISEEEREYEEEMAQLQDIHAKLFARSKYNNHHFYIGSANCSHYAFHGNVEFLLKLKYKKYGFRLYHLLEDFFGEDEEDNPFEQITALPEREEKQTDLNDQLQKFIKKLCRIDSTATVINNNDSYSLSIDFENIPEEVSLTIGPLLSKQQKKLEQKTTFDNLGLTELTEFYRVIAEIDGEQVERIVKINTEGIPISRNSEIYRSVIKDPTTFLKYVAFLLADDFLLAALEQFENRNSTYGSWEFDANHGPVLYENMLKAVSRTPEKLSDVEHIIEVIDDEEIIPDDFEHLYRTFKSADQKRWKK